MQPTRNGLADATLSFIGGGNMARALIGGLRRRGVPGTSIRVGEPGDELRAALVRDFGVHATADNLEAVREAEVVVLAVKPQVMRPVLTALAPGLAEHSLLVSVAAGITTAQVRNWAGSGRRVVRVMPNTPALVGRGASGLFAGPGCTERDRARAEELLAAVGVCAWIDDEALMDAVTALSGSGPAYVFLLAEAMQAAGEAEGLPREVARLLARHTLIGAAAMLDQQDEEAAELRRRVTSPGGTTQAALEALREGGFEALLARAVHAARQRGVELARAAEG